MVKKYFPVVCFVCFLLVGCFPSNSSKRNVENALLIQPVLVTDLDMTALQDVHNFPESMRRIGVLLGYGYNDENFLSSVKEELRKVAGLVEEGGIVKIFVFPDDFKRGSSGRISLLPSIIEELNLEGLIIVGAPEGTHNSLEKINTNSEDGPFFPIFSLFPQDDILGMEANCDLVIEFISSAEDEAMLKEEIELNLQGVPELIGNAVKYMVSIPTGTETDFEKSIKSLFEHTRLLVGENWIVSQYVDPETGIRPRNHFLIENNQQNLELPDE